MTTSNDPDAPPNRPRSTSAPVKTAVAQRLQAEAERLDARWQRPPATRQLHVPSGHLYLDGNSLGPYTAAAADAVQRALTAWADWGVLGWSEPETGWHQYAERIAGRLGRLVGAEPGEVVVGGTTTQQLHQLVATYYRPTPNRRGILMEGGAFPTDVHAATSQVVQAGLDPRAILRTVDPDASGWISPDQIVDALTPDVALAILPGVVYTTGQRLPLREISAAARARDIPVIWDLSHSAGLVPHRLHDEADLAVFCTYKYLNGGPGSPAAAFVHRRLHPIDPALKGWWGSDKASQFAMAAQWTGAADAGALQLGTPSILALAALDGSLSLFDTIPVASLLERALALTDFLIKAADAALADYGVTVATPRDPTARAGHVALAHPDAPALSLALRAERVIVDFRPPNLIRMAPAPLYIDFADVAEAVVRTQEILKHQRQVGYRARAASAAVT